MSRIFSENLNQILNEPDPRFTATELAEVAGVSRSTIYKDKNDQAELSTSKARALAHHVASHGDTRLARCFLPPEYEIKRKKECRTDGLVDDDVADLTEATGQARRIYKDGGKRTDFDDALDDAEQAIRNARAEGGNL
jgi:DNA-binding XRE family transcriptional regulator